MNPLIKIIRNTLNAVNGLINGLSKNVENNIKQGFYFLVFVLAIVVIFIGYNMGQEAARIKSPPLAKDVREVFDIDISKEKGESGSLTMQDSKFILEYQRTREPKLPYPIKSDLKPEADVDIIDDMGKKRQTEHPDMKHQSDIIEGKYRPEKRETSNVDILHEEKKEKDPAPVTPQYPGKKIKTIKIIKDEKGARSIQNEPKQILRDRGIIEK